jgi:hypothetical protein
MGGLILTADVVAWLQRATTNVEDFVTELSGIDWLLLALAAAAFWWLWAMLRALTRLGPVEVAALDHDGDRTANVLALTAMLRERLANTGLVPPTVPAGAPKANLIAAVEASPIPQGPWIGKILAALPSLPRPPRYKVTGTLLGVEPASTGLGSPARPCGLSFWVSPDGAGEPLLDTVEKCATHGDAVTAAAARIYVYIANGATSAFPVWVRWRTEQALDDYREGCRYLRSSDWAEAEQSLERAITDSPFNALGRLQLGNLYEQRTATTEQHLLEARMQAEALRNYLEVAREWPGLVEARYRASVIAATLGATLQSSDAALIRERLRLRGTETGSLAQQLRDLGRAESSAVLQLLRPWYALLHDGRLRNQFEPKAHERRALKHVIRISKHCVLLRALPDDARVWPWLRELIVHKGHMLAGRSNLNWQAYYNAACFDAVLLERRKRSGEDLASDRTSDLRGRALHNLRIAIREAGPELSSVWVARADPDLAYFRAPLDEDFQEIVEKLPQAAVEQLDEHEQSSLLPPLTDRKLIDLPVRPWGNPRTRFRIWLGIVVVYAIAWLLVVSVAHPALWPTSLVLLIPLVPAVWRLLTAYFEKRVEWEKAASGVAIASA